MKRARPEKLRENCIVEVGERDVDRGEEGEMRERVVLGRGQSGCRSFISLRLQNASKTQLSMAAPVPRVSLQTVRLAFECK